MPTANLTKTEVDKIDKQKPAQGQILFWDSRLKGFGLRATPGALTYVIQGRDAAGETVRTTIGRHGVFTAEEARDRAKILLGELADGRNPNDEKAAAKAKAVTLIEAYEAYKEDRQLRPASIKVYDNAMNRCFPEWQNKPITAITKEMVGRKYAALCKFTGPHATSNGEAQAHQAMRFLKSLLNFAAAKYEDADGKSILPENPVKRFSQQGKFKKVGRRKEYIHPDDLKAWYQAVMELPNATTRDYLLLCLFTGLRRNEAAKLKWANVNLQRKTLTIPKEDSKTHEEHCLPLSDFLVDLLTRRKNDKVRKIANPYVFDGDGANGHFVESKWSQAKIAEKTANRDRPEGIKFRIHDLRRSFISYGESQDIAFLALKKLLNHKVSDMTADYAQIDVERLRKPMQTIANFIKEKAGITKTKSPAPRQSAK